MPRSAGVAQETFDSIRNSQAPGMDREAVEGILREYFSGRRDAQRALKFFDLDVHGRHGRFSGMCVDISRSGLLLRIVDPGFARPEEMTALMPYTARVWYHLQGGFSLELGDSGVMAPADVVRVTGYCGRVASLILIGCRFRHDLSEAQCRALDIPHADDVPPGT